MKCPVCGERLPEGMEVAHPSCLLAERLEREAERRARTAGAKRQEGKEKQWLGKRST